jgi:hypothetical protein
MNRIVIIFKLLIAMLPALAVGYIFRYFFPFLPEWLQVAPFILLIAGGIYFIYKNRKIRIDNDEEDYLPEWLHKSSYVYIILGSIMGLFLTASSFRTSVSFDNGRNTTVKITLNKNSTFEVSPKNFYNISMPKGENEIIIDGKVSKINVESDGKWVYNIDNLNSYYIESIDYSNPNTLYKNGKIDSTLLNQGTIKILSGELIKAEVDYLFNAPESITVKKRDAKESISKKVLFRILKE